MAVWCPTVGPKELPVWADDHDTVRYLAEIACPRCHAMGLVPISCEELDAATAKDRHEGEGRDPSESGKCPACGLVGEW